MKRHQPRLGTDLGPGQPDGRFAPEVEETITAVTALFEKLLRDIAAKAEGRFFATDPRKAPDVLLTAEEASAYLAVSIRTLDRWRAIEKGPKFTKLSGYFVRYRRGDLDAYVAEQDPTFKGKRRR